MCVPAEHHTRSLWISAKGEIEGRAIDDTKSINTENTIRPRVHHFVHQRAAMVICQMVCTVSLHHWLREAVSAARSS